MRSGKTFSSLLLSAIFLPGATVAAPALITLQGQVLSIPQDDFRLLEKVRPGEMVRYQFMVDFGRQGIMRTKDEVVVYADSNLGARHLDHFFDSLVSGAHLASPNAPLTEELHGTRESQGQVALASLTYLGGDFQRVLGIQATFTNNPAASPELWVGQSGTLVESLSEFQGKKQSRLFASVQVVEVTSLTTALDAPFMTWGKFRTFPDRGRMRQTATRMNKPGWQSGKHRNMLGRSLLAWSGE